MTRRNWCFTVNAPEDIEAFGLPEDTSKIRYACWQLEKAPSTGHEHIQGYLELNQAMRMAGVKVLFNCNGMHLSERRATRDQARAYCMKDDTSLGNRFEFGTFKSSQGKRTDLNEACQIMKADGMDSLVDWNPAIYVKYSRGLKELEFRLNQKKFQENRPMKVICIWGQTGVGKTRCAMSFGRSLTWYKLDMSANGSTLWWDGYQGEDVLIVDDFYGWIPFGKLLNLLDIYPVRLDVKGSHAWANWTKVIITSNKPPENWYKELSDTQLDALLRRIHHTFHIDQGEEIPNLEECFVSEVAGNTSATLPPQPSP